MLLLGPLLGVRVLLHRLDVASVVGMGMSALAACWLSWIALRLAHVWADEEDIKVRILWRKTQVPYARIIKVSAHNVICMFLVVVPLVTLSVRMPDGRVKKFRFIARFTLKGWVRRTHPDVVFLRRMTGLA